MIMEGKIREYLTLSVSMAFVSYVIIYTLIFIHEMAHGCTALALGGYFPFVQIGISNGSAVYFFPMGTAGWKDVMVLLAGPLSNFLIALTMMGLVATGIKRRQLRLPAILVGGLSALGFITGTGLLFVWWSGNGDIGRALNLMHFSRTLRFLSGGIWLLLAIAMVVSFVRLLFKELAKFFPVETYKSRLLLVFSTIGAPILIIIGIQSLSNFSNNPSGLFLSRKPPEVTVSACNVRLTIREDYSARACILMRPFISQHRFLWEQVKNTEPESWAYYDQFVRENLPLMLVTDNFHIVSRRADPEAPFFNGDWDNGARVIEAEVNLSQLPYMRGPQSNRVLRIVDFWRNRGIGYLDFIEIKLEGSLQIYDHKSQPDSAGSPILLSNKQLQWENPSFEKGFAVSYLAIR